MKKKITRQLGIVVHALEEAGGSPEFRASLVYIWRSRTVRTT